MIFILTGEETERRMGRYGFPEPKHWNLKTKRGSKEFVTLKYNENLKKLCWTQGVKDLMTNLKEAWFEGLDNFF